MKSLRLNANSQRMRRIEQIETDYPSESASSAVSAGNYLSKSRCLFVAKRLRYSKPEMIVLSCELSGFAAAIGQRIEDPDLRRLLSANHCSSRASRLMSCWIAPPSLRESSR